MNTCTSLLLAITVGLLAAFGVTHAWPRWDRVAELWKNYDLTPAEKDWMGHAKIPGAPVGCCGEADGQPIDWDIREGHYWANWDGGWHEIPDDKVLKDGNVRFPVIWLTPGHKVTPDGKGNYKDEGYRDVRCFWPGPGA